MRRSRACPLFSALSEGFFVHQGEPHTKMILPSLFLPFQDAIQKLGGIVHDGEKVVEIKPGLPVAVKTTSRELPSQELDHAGPWTNQLLRPLGAELPLQVGGTRSLGGHV